MATIKHILLFDFSRQGTLAIPFVRAVAERFVASVTVIGVMSLRWGCPF
jgi:hypothetical protein